MAEGEGSPEPEPEPSDAKPATNGDPKQGSNLSTSEGGDDGEEDEEEEEPRLKYTTVTTRLSSLYRNGDAVSALLVAGDKMV
jgi:vacuolar protein sorting-associated protein 41